MKRLILAIVAIFSMVGTAFAHECFVKDMGLNITIPDTYIVATRDWFSRVNINEIPPSYRMIFTNAGEELDKASCELFAIKTNDALEVDYSLIIYEPWNFTSEKEEDFRTCSDDEFEKYMQIFFKKMKGGYPVKIIGELETDAARFIKGKCPVKIEDDYYRFAYFSIVSGHVIEIHVTSVTEELPEEIDEMIKSIRFNGRLEKEQAKTIAITKAEKEKARLLRRIELTIVILLVVPVMILAPIFMVRSVIKKRREKARDAALMAQVKKHCISCGAAMAEDAEVCTECGMRQ